MYGITSDYIENNCSDINGATFFRLSANGSMDIKEKTGYHDISELREMSLFRNFSYPLTSHPLLKLLLTVWETEECVDGSRQMGQFPPNYWVSGEPLNIWSTEKFRKVPYIYQKSLKYKGLNLLRFRVSDEIWMNMSESPVQKNYRMYDLPSGLVNLTNVRGTPVFVSKGHFYNYEFYEQSVNQRFNIKMLDIDVNGDLIEDEDDQYFDIDPISGIAFRNYHTYQLNFRAIYPWRNYTSVFSTSNISWWNSIIPFARVKVRAFVTDDQIEDYANTINFMIVLKDMSMYGGPVVAVLFIGCAIAIIIKVKKVRYEKNMRFDVSVDDSVQSECLVILYAFVVCIILIDVCSVMKIPAYSKQVHSNEGISDNKEYQTFGDVCGGEQSFESVHSESVAK